MECVRAFTFLDGLRHVLLCLLESLIAKSLSRQDEKGRSGMIVQTYSQSSVCEEVSLNRANEELVTSYRRTGDSPPPTVVRLARLL